MLILDRRELLCTYCRHEHEHACPKCGCKRTDRLIDEIRRTGVELDVATLEFGDMLFEGHGEHGDALIGIERKRLTDLINSMKDRRLAGHQLRGLWQAYDYVFLVAEGEWRPGPGGEIQELGKDRRTGKWGWQPVYGSADRTAVSYRQLSAFLHSLSLRSRSLSHEPLRIIRTRDCRHTAAEVASLYLGFTEKRWDEHHAHDQIYCNVPKKGHGGRWAKVHGHVTGGAARVATVTRNGNSNGLDDHPSTLWRAAAQLPGVDRRARAITEHFGSIRRMALAGLPEDLLRLVEEWLDTHPKEVERAWRQVDGVGEAVARASIRAVSERGA